MIKKSAFGILLALYGLLFLYLSPAELTGDSYGYACEILKQDLWNAHHILHKYFLHDLFLIVKPIGIHIDPLDFFRFVHLLISFASLLVLRAILQHRHWSDTRVYLAILMVASSFVFIKYAFENEVYFYPILLSLVGSYQFEQGKRFQAALWLGFATLFHQIHIFWLIGLLFPKKIKQMALYTPLIVGLSIPVLIYSIIGLLGHIPIGSLIFQDVQAGLVQVLPDSKNILFFGVNLIRTWVQVHGDIGLIWKLWNPFYSGIAILIIIYITLGLVVFLRERRFNFQQNDWHGNYALALFLQWLFAFYSVGNIEFMVMVPFLVVLTMKHGSLLKHSLVLSVGMLVWNWTQWSFPLSKWDIQRLNHITQTSKRIAYFDPNNASTTTERRAIFLASNASLYQNYHEYQQLKESNDSTNGVRFLPLEAKDSLSFYYEIREIHHRLNRSKLQIQPLDSNSINPNVSQMLIYRDTGIAGVLEFWRVEKRLVTNSNK